MRTPTQGFGQLHAKQIFSYFVIAFLSAALQRKAYLFTGYQIYFHVHLDTLFRCVVLLEATREIKIFSMQRKKNFIEYSLIVTCNMVIFTMCKVMQGEKEKKYMHLTYTSCRHCTACKSKFVCKLKQVHILRGGKRQKRKKSFVLEGITGSTIYESTMASAKKKLSQLSPQTKNI